MGIDKVTAIVLAGGSGKRMVERYDFSLLVIHR